MEYENCCRTCLCVVKNIPVKLTDEIYEFLAKDLGIRSVPKEHPELQLPQIVCSNCNSQIMELQQFLTKCREVEKYFKSKLELLNLTHKDMECNGNKKFIRIDPREDVTNTLDTDNNVFRNFNDDDFTFATSIIIKEEPQLQEIQLPTDDTNTFDSDEVLLEYVNDNDSIVETSSADNNSLKEATKVKGKSKKNPRKRTIRKNKSCSLCGKLFEKNSFLRDHENTHKGIKTHCCDICGKCFICKKDLNVHIKDVHIKDAQFDKFGKICARDDRTNYNEKHKNKHKAEPKFQCNICRHTFFSAVNLHEHKDTVHSKLSYQCDRCYSWFSTLIGIRNHMATKHDIKMENFQHLKKTKNVED